MGNARFVRRTSRRLQSAGFAALAALAGCGGPSPDAMAESTTRAVYANDFPGTVKYFDDPLKVKVTRGSLGELSDMMHQRGKIRSFKEIHADKDTRTYEYAADLEHGALVVQIRLDPQGKISGYHVQPSRS